MHISKDGENIIVGGEELSNVIISQLIFWNFMENREDKLYYRKIGEERSLLPKLLHYLDYMNVKYVLSNEVRDLVESYEIRTQDFLNVKVHARNIKEGKFEIKDFEKYVGFLKEHIFVNRQLKNHQTLSSYFLYSLGNGAIFSVPGSGKTSVVLSVYEKLRLDKIINALFVVGPPACLVRGKKSFQKHLAENRQFVYYQV